MNRTPLIILTKDNPEYLHVTLRSLMATETFESPMIIVDDSSESQNGKAYLYSDETIDVKLDDWTADPYDQSNSQEYADKVAGASYLKIPEISKIKGLKGRFTIVKTPTYLGKLHRILYGMNIAFSNYPTATMCALLDDDIMFNRDWLKEGYKLYEYEHFKKKVGMICLFAEKSTDEDSIEYYMDSIVRGKAVLATRRLFDALARAGLYRGLDINCEGPTWFKLQKLTERFGFTCYSTRQSYIQSLEKRNLVNKEKILMYDSNFVKPIAWNENFN